MSAPFVDTVLSRLDSYAAAIVTAARAGHDATEKQVHELRVATKRLRAVVELVRTMFHRGGKQPLRKLFRAAAGLRDTQVQRELARSTKLDLDPLLAKLDAREKKERRHFVRAAATFDESSLAKVLHEVQAALAVVDDGAALALARCVFARWLAALTPLRRDLHEQRKLVKRAHSIAYLLHDCGAVPNKTLQHLDRLQKLLGKWHDDEVALTITKDEAYRFWLEAQKLAAEERIQRLS